jgi:hypothetical protein
MREENKARATPETFEQRCRARVIADYQAENPDPITVAAGETFQISKNVFYWKDNPDWMWIWCTDQRGKSGWVPRTAIEFRSDDTTGNACYTYCATELTVVIGEELLVTQEESGWFWCINRQGKSGWVPLDHVTLLS